MMLNHLTTPKLLAASVALSLLWGMPADHGASAQAPATDTQPTTANAADTEQEAPDQENGAPGNAEDSVKPGINATFLDPTLDVPQFINRFEVESREVFRCREQILAAAGLKSGQRVADIGAGTGLFVTPFAKAVGSEGRVFAVDIAPRFIEHVRKLARAQNLNHVETVLCRENSVALPDNSIDVAFVCDTYHHFEFPKSTLASIVNALRPGGSLLIVDFERIPGVSSDWIMGHVRAGKDEVRAEIEGAGFKFIEEVEIDGLDENYFLRFKLPMTAPNPE